MKCLAWLKPRPRYKGELFQSLNGEWRFRLKAANGEIVAQSEGYTRKESALDTLRMIARAKIEVEVLS